MQRSQQEPETRRVHRIDPELAEGLLDAADLVAQGTLLLEAFLVDNPIHHTLPETTPFTNAVDEALQILATSIKKEQPLETFPNLKESLSALEHAVQSMNSSTQQVTTIGLQMVLTEAKSIVRSVNTMKQLLATRTE